MQIGMNFGEWVDKLTRRLAQPLPGPVAHNAMRATFIGALKPNFEHKLPQKPGSVLILLEPNLDAIQFPLTLRADYLGTNSGQGIWPEGKGKPGENYKRQRCANVK